MRYFILILLALSTPVLAGGKADYILLSNPDSVLILNKYEQKTDVRFLPGTPFRIIEQQHLLSDGITGAYLCSYNKKDWFLLPLSGKLSIFKNGTVLNDSIRLTHSGLTMHTEDGQKKIVPKESRIVRFFSKGGKTYILYNAFGWARLSKNNWEKMVKKDAGSSAFPVRLRSRILGRMESVNAAYRTFFSFFNQKYHTNYKSPQWLYEQKGQELRLYLKADEVAGSLKESFKSIESDLQKMVMGSGYQSLRKRNQFIISVRTDQ